MNDATTTRVVNGPVVTSRALTGLRHELSGLLVIAQRDVIKLLRDRPRLAVNLAFPVLLIGGLGAILQPTVGRVTGLNAVTLAFTGVLAASLFQSAAAGMISIVADRENDFSPDLDVLAHLMPMRYVVELTRAAFYAGTPGYRQVVSGSPVLDAAVTLGLFVIFMITGAAVFGYRERTR